MVVRVMGALISTCILPALCAAAGEPGISLSGKVLDRSEAVVPGAVVRVHDPGTGASVQVVTDPVGVFVARLPRSGTYNLAVSAAGFEAYARDGVRVGGGAAVVNVVLEVASRAEQVTVSARAPDITEALEVRQVRESSARDVGEALVKVDGLWKVRKGAVANDVVLRGFQQDNLNVLIDGVRIYGACPASMDPPASHVDFAEIQEVEVTKGPFDVRNQGSMGGLVNVIKKAPGSGLRLTPALALGSFGYVNPSLTGSFSRRALAISGGHSFRQADAYRDGAGRRITDYANYRDTASGTKAFEINTSWLRASYAVAENHNVEFSYTRQREGTVLYPYLQMDAKYDDADRLSAFYHADEPFAGVRQLRVQTYFTQVKHWMTDEFRTTSVGAPRPYGMATYAGTKALGARAEADVSVVTVGVETYRRNWNTVNTLRLSGKYTDQATVPNVDTTVAGAFADFRKTVGPGIHLGGGARIDTAGSSPRMANVGTDLYWAYNGTRAISARDTYASGNFRVAYSMTPGLDLFAGVGRGMRLPDQQERYFSQRRMGTDWVGNPSLKPTSNTEVDLGVNYRARRFSVRPTLFYSRLGNYIAVHNQPRVNAAPGIMNAAAISYANVDATIAGGEMAGDISLTRALLLSGGVSYARGRKDRLPAARIFDRDIAEMPAGKARTALRYGSARFFAEIESLLSAPQGKVDSDLRELRTPGYAVVNVKGGFHGRKLDAAIGIDNIGNRFYWEHLSYQRDPFRSGARVPEVGRYAFGSVSWAF